MEREGLSLVEREGLSLVEREGLSLVEREGLIGGGEGFSLRREGGGWEGQI